MPRREWRLRVVDILDAVHAILDYTAGIDEEGFFEQRVLFDAVLKNVAVIGEAATHLPRSLMERHPDVPWSAMRAMRNVVVHEYFAVSRRALWGTVKRDLPELVPLLERVLADDWGLAD